VIGEKFAKAIRSGKSVRFIGDCRVRLETPSTLKRTNEIQGLLAFYADKKMLDAVDAVSEARLTVVVPWTMDDDIASWRKTWNPTIVGEDEKPAERIVENPVVAAALSSLTVRVNLSTGILHPSDHAAATDLFHILKKNKVPFVPGDVRAWCVRSGWQPKFADDVQRVAEQALRSKSTPRGTGSSWAANIFEQWSKGI
jgi:hypothetical protein